MKSKRFFILLLLSIFIGVAFLGYKHLKNQTAPDVKVSKEEAKDLVMVSIQDCSKLANTNLCFKQASEKILKEVPLALIFQVIEENEKKSTELFQYCHEFLHFVGQVNYTEVGDPAKALKQGNPLCFAGYYHGVLEGFLKANSLFDPEDIAKEMPTICEDLTIEKDRNECLHGLGHALMFATNSDLPKSLQLCDFLPSEADRSWCYSGIFMENSTSSTNKDHPSQYLKKDDPMYPCNILENKYLAMCYTLQGFYFAEISGYDWEKTGQMCLKVPKPYDESCFNSIGQSQVGFTTDPKIMKANCELNPEFVQPCYIGLVGALEQRYNSREKIDELCALFPENYREICRVN